MLKESKSQYISYIFASEKRNSCCETSSSIVISTLFYDASTIFTTILTLLRPDFNVLKSNPIIYINKLPIFC